MNVSPKPDANASVILAWKGGMSLTYLTTYITYPSEIFLIHCSLGFYFHLNPTYP